uniref:Transmembrane protein 200B n=1 Tax=Leptobrachium leishanense TaxID=445787 RepID=A0A8C5LVX3_9ANUR
MDIGWKRGEEGPAHRSFQSRHLPCFLWLFRRCRPPTTGPEALPKGKLRFHSLPGAFVFLGFFLVLVGLTVAVFGYWTHKPDGPSPTTPPPVPPKPYAERLKLIGPVIMGVGLFIFICANTLLYENRDTETRQLLQNLVASQGANHVGLSAKHGLEIPSQNTWVESSGELDNRRNILIRAQLLCPPINDLSGSMRALDEPHRGAKCRSWPRIERVEDGYTKLDDSNEAVLEETRESSQETVPETV